MNLMWIVALVLIMLLVIFVFTILKKLIKIAIIFGIIFALIFFFTGGTIISDFSKLKENMNSEQKVFLSYNNKFYAGFVYSGEYNPLDDLKLKEYETLYVDKKLSDIKENSYKVYVFNTDSLLEFENFDVNNKLVKSTDVISYFVNDVKIPSITYADLVIDKNLNNISTSMKNMLFIYLYEKELKMDKSPVIFFKNYKETEITVYPESLFFKFTKLIPLDWMKQKLNNLKDTIKNKVNEETGKIVNSTIDNKLK